MKKAHSLCLALALLSALAGAAEGRSATWAVDEAAMFPYDETLDKASLAPLGLAAIWPAGFALVCGKGQPLPAASAYGEALALTYAAKELMKKAFPRDRPYTYEGGTLEGELLEEAEESFPSGHTALAFCGATSFATLALRLAPGAPATPWLVAGGYAFALGTAVLRVASGCHFVSDALAGAALGSGIGWLVTEANIRFGPLGRSKAGGAEAKGAGPASSIGLSPSSIIVSIRL
jgi:membrane-associated phospholipid phosphatase